jgi:hypothetical protein
MSLKVMSAGCSAEEKERAESDVRRALGPRAESTETWVVSVVSVANRWSVTVDGPGIHALHCTANPGRLSEAIRDALQAKTGAAPAAPPPYAAAPAHAPGNGAAAAPRPVSTPARPASPAPVARAPVATAVKSVAPPLAPPAPRPAPSAVPISSDGDTHACATCAQQFTVVCDSMPGEERQTAPVACPHCWHVNHVPVPLGAAMDHDYRAEKA